VRAASHLSDETACLRPAGGGIVARLAAVALCLLSTPLPTNAQETTRTLLPAPVIPVPASIDRADVDVGVAALDGIVSEAMQATGVPGVAVAIVYQDDVIFEKGYGLREAGRPEPVDPDTVFLLASLSKPITSTVVARLSDLHHFELDEPVGHHDPDFRLADPYVSEHATFIDLLSHRSGLATGAGDFLEDLGFDRDTILDRLHMQPLDDFRSTYHYSNYGYTAGGVAAAKAAGGVFEELAEEVLFQPLGMTRTSYRNADYLAHENRARIHVRNDAGEWEARFHRDPDAQAPAGGVSSTVNDLAEFLRLQLAGGMRDGERLIDPAVLTVTHKPHSVSSNRPDSAARDGFYGLGWGVSYDDIGRVVLSHSGAFDLGAATNLTLLPGEGLGIAVLSNGMPVGVVEAIATTFVDIATHGEQTVAWLALFGGAFDAMREGERADAAAAIPTGDPGPELPLEAYTGAYANSYFGLLEIRVEGGQLMATMGPRTAPVTFTLTRDEGSRFVFETIGEWATGPSVAFFSGAEGGRPARVLFAAYDMQGLGTFERE